MLEAERGAHAAEPMRKRVDGELLEQSCRMSLMESGREWRSEGKEKGWSQPASLQYGEQERRGAPCPSATDF